MSYETIVSAVSTLGFPIVICGCMMWFVYYMYNKNMEQLEDERQKHQEEISNLREVLENNTLAINTLVNTLKGDDNK